MSMKQGDTKINLGSSKNYFGEHQENNSGRREERVKFQWHPGAGDPTLRSLLIITTHNASSQLEHPALPCSSLKLHNNHSGQGFPVGTRYCLHIV